MQLDEESKSFGTTLTQTDLPGHESGQQRETENELEERLWESEQKFRAALACEQKARAEAEARASQLEATFEAIADGVIIQDAEGRILHANAAARELLALDKQPCYTSYSPNERASQHVPRDEHGQPLPEEQWPSFRILKGEILKGTTAVDLLLRTLDDRELQINASGAPVRDSGGSIIGGVFIFRDVTERCRLEQRARDALGALLSMAEVLVQIPGVNSGTEEYTPTTASEIARQLAELTRSVLECQRIAITVVEPETEALRVLAVVGLSAEHEQQWWADQLPKEMRLSDSSHPELVERLRANEVLLIDMMQPQFGDAPNLYNVGVVLIAPMCVGEQFVGTLTLDYGGAVHDYTPGEIALAGAVAKLAGLVIERERLLQERCDARANELALREGNRRMDEFLGIVSHELRTPLTAIKGNIQLAQLQLKKVVESALIRPAHTVPQTASIAAGYAGASTLQDTSSTELPLLPFGSDEVQGVRFAQTGRMEEIGLVEGVVYKLESVQDLLERADRQIGMQNRLVSDLLDVSRIQANKLELRLEPCDLADIVREAILDQRRASPMRTISLELSCEEEVPVVVDVDRIGQVVTNYLTNALKYSEFDRPIEVSLQVVSEDSLEGQVARVSVRDEGPGLSEVEQQRIWERFYCVRGIEVQSGTGIGLGLGLHICKTIIECHHGQVGVQSVPGQGSTFWFTLPVER